MRLNFDKVRNPVSETMIVTPDGCEPITFKLKPITTGTAFAVESWKNEEDQTMKARIQFDIAVTRIDDWQDVCDESGNEIPFTKKNFSMFCNLQEAIPYMMEIGFKTIEEVFDEREKKMKKTSVQSQNS